jgi:hypothetical protein
MPRIIHRRTQTSKQWRMKHAAAISAYNAFVEEHGIYSEGIREANTASLLDVLALGDRQVTEGRTKAVRTVLKDTRQRNLRS